MPACSLAGVYFMVFLIFGHFWCFGCFGALEAAREREERERRKNRKKIKKKKKRRKWKRRKKKKKNKLFEESGFWGKRAKPSEIAGKSPFLVSGLSYFSFDSGCFYLTSVLIFFLLFFCLSSVFLLSFFRFLDSGFFCLDSVCLTSVLQRTDGHHLNKKK